MSNVFVLRTNQDLTLVHGIDRSGVSLGGTIRVIYHRKAQNL